MPDHLFCVNAHKDVAQAVRLCRVLRSHFGDGSGVLVHYDGPDYATEPQAVELAGLAAVKVYPHQPDKCRGVCDALSRLVYRAGELGAEFVSLLHPDMVPTDRAAWRGFLQRFRASGKALTWSPMHPGHMALSFCNLHFRLPDAARLFPIECHRVEEWPGGGWFNEMQATLHFDRAWPEWRSHAYPMALMTVPYTGHHLTHATLTPCVKLMHAPGGTYAYHDYVPESSVVHTDDDLFWDNFKDIVRC